MAEINYLFSTLLMGLSLLAIGWTLTRLRAWQRYSPTPSAAAADAGGYTFGTPDDGGSVVTRIARSPVAWIVGFVLLAFAFGGGAVVFISGSTFPAGVTQGVGMALAALTLGLLALYLFVVVYRSAKGRGLPDSQAAVVGAWVFGLLLVAVVTTKLVMQG